MDRTTRYAAINTKIEAMEANFLNANDYKTILSKKSINDIALYLKENTYYSKALSSIVIDRINRIELETAIKNSMAQNGEKIANYFNGEYKSFIQTVFMRYEIEDIKYIARGIYNKRTIDNLERNAYLGRFTKIDKNKIFNAKFIRDIIYSMENTELYRYFIPLIDGNIDENLFRFETVLDLSYYSILKKSVEKLHAEDISVLKKGLGLIADLLNIQWVYRGIKYYKISAEELLNYTIGFGSNLSFNDKKRLCYSKNVSELYSLLQDTRYDAIFPKEKDDIFMDRIIFRYIGKELKKLDKAHPMTIMKAFNFIIFSEYEVKDIVSAVEIVGYGVNDRDWGKYLIKSL